MIENIFLALGNWWTFLGLLSLASLFFGYWIPKSKVKIFLNAPPDLPRKILDEYFWTWTPEVAITFFEKIGPEGRLAYLRYYWQMDFWFPVLTASLANTSLLLIALGPSSNFAWVSVLAMLGLVFDLAENVNHFIISKTYPALPSYSLKIGPVFTFVKWIFAVAPIPAAIVIFILRGLNHYSI